jgi:hypothetical protein
VSYHNGHHTPGPWVMRRFPTSRGGCQAWWILDSIPDGPNGQVIANAIAQATGTNDDEEANARLISASPDLLAACEALPLDCEFKDAADFKDNSRAFLEAMSLARAAVAKAKGE